MMRDTVNSQPDKEKNVYNNVGANGYSGRFIPDRATVSVVTAVTSLHPHRLQNAFLAILPGQHNPFIDFKRISAF
jgi:hypothetical protein